MNNETKVSHNIEIIFIGQGNTNDAIEMQENLVSEYPEFTISETQKKCDRNHVYTCHFIGTWVGDTDSVIRLTHHAEPLYNDTKFEYVHVEVCVDGIWHGRNTRK